MNLPKEAIQKTTLKITILLSMKSPRDMKNNVDTCNCIIMEQLVDERL